MRPSVTFRVSSYAGIEHVTFWNIRSTIPGSLGVRILHIIFLSLDMRGDWKSRYAEIEVDPSKSVYHNT